MQYICTNTHSAKHQYTENKIIFKNKEKKIKKQKQTYDNDKRNERKAGVRRPEFYHKATNALTKQN